MSYFKKFIKMDKETLKSFLVRDKSFLRQLYEGQDKMKNNKILNFASDVKLNTLIKFLHFLSNGEIKMKRQNFEILQKNRKVLLLKRYVEKKAQVARLLKSERAEKLKFLRQLSNVYSALLYCLFNET
jgi:hypothetical protein